MTIINPIKTLTDCHQEVLKQLENLKELAANLSEDKNLAKFKKGFAKFVDFFNTSLALHTRDEEQALFPILKYRLASGEEGIYGALTPIEIMMDEHKNTHSAVNLIEELLKINGKQFQEIISEKCDFIANTMSEHIHKENDILYEIAKAELSEDDLARVSREMSGFREQSDFSCSH